MTSCALKTPIYPIKGNTCRRFYYKCYLVRVIPIADMTGKLDMLTHSVKNQIAEHRDRLQSKVNVHRFSRYSS